MNYQRIRTISTLFKRDFATYLTSNNDRCTKTNFVSITKYKLTPILQPWNLLHFCDFPSKCWQCDYPQKSELFCSKCKALQKLPRDLNYFDIIGIKKEFNISLQNLQTKYRNLQALLHPDRFGQKSEKEKQISENLSSLVNKAYSTLLQPLDRGLYMLKLNNVSIPEESSGSDPEFLMEIMEKNEEIEEAAENKEKTFKLLKENQATLTSLTKQISEAFQNEDIEQAKQLLIKMKYYISIDKRLKILKNNLGIVE